MTTPAARPTNRHQPLLVVVFGLLLGFAGLAGLALDDAAAADQAAPVAGAPDRFAGPGGTATRPAVAGNAAPALPAATVGDLADRSEAATAAPVMALDGPQRQEADDPSAERERPAADAAPEARDPERVMIPGIGVDAELVELGLADDRSMELPDFGYAGWYTEGPAPGEPGPAVIVAHVDDLQGPDVFFELERLRPGDEILVPAADGSTATFIVEDMEFIKKEALPVDRIWAPSDEPGLTLITCGGTFDPRTGHYESNLIVYTSPA